MPIAARLPSTVETAAEVSAIKKLLKRLVQSASDSNKSFLYQIREKPVKFDPFPSLNEYAMMTKSGINKKNNVISKIVKDKEKCFF